ncbi:MAG: endonuclease [Muribaculaceae bacterium]|nr:endonuclease [Muribaculaceae bacterium]
MKVYGILSAGLAACVSFLAPAAEPAGYYTSCEGKSGKALLQQLEQVVGTHTTVSYDGLWDLYKSSDARPNGTVWDMYSTKEYSFGSKCGNYSKVGDCYNREHSFPKSWFDDKKPMYSDAFHLYPTDGRVNGQRSNYPYGECAGGTTLPGSGSVKALGRLGKSTFAGYSGTVFEPDDEYKGDFARSYFYMCAAYNSRFATWHSDMLAGNNYPGFKPWAVELLLKWHRQDPVSKKELDRQEAVYARQRNRNPFIDHPELAEHIWGDKQGQGWSATATTEPALLLPVANSTVNIGSTVPGVSRSAQMVVKGVALEGAVSLSVTGEGFAVSPATVSRSQAQASDGYAVTVSYTGTRSGSHTGVLTLACGSLSRKVNLAASVVDNLPAGPVTGLGDRSFAATWSYVGDADSHGEYVLDVRHEGESLDGYPMSVTATDERFVVEDLEPLTTYTYTVKSAHLVSDVITVVTLAPQPLVEILFDGDLRFTAAAGEPSEAAELLMLVENIDTDIIVSVGEPFELSTDKSEWSRSLVLDPEEDRFYLRMNSASAGTFHGTIKVVAGDYINDDADFEGTAVSQVGFYEDFEADAGGCGTYNGCTFEGNAATWTLKNAGIWPGDRCHTGDQAVRAGKNADSSVEMITDNPAGFGTVSVWTAQYNNDGECVYELEYSADEGQTWRSAGSGTVGSKTYTQQTFTVNCSGPSRIRVRQTAGQRFNIDDIEATAYMSSLVPDYAEDYHRWDAYARGGSLVIEASEPVTVRVYAIDGTEVYMARVNGETSLSVPAALYIVAVDDFARRVLVK